MTTRATFGDFATAATRHLNHPARPPAPGSRPVSVVGDVGEFTRSLRTILAVLTRYSADIETAIARLPHAERRQLGPWLRASSRTREALRNATAFLGPAPPHPHRPEPATRPDPAARRISTAATMLTTGRDLLHTHHATRPGGDPAGRSEWAPILTSPPVTRALLHQLAAWARQIAPYGGQLAVARAPVRGTPEDRRRLNAACQWLWVLDWAVQAAHEHHPVTDADIALLHAIPVSTLAPRHQPDGTEPVTALCQGIIDTAERVRHHARAAVPQAAWSPALTSESLRETAAYATVISHNCHILLRTLAAHHGTPGLTAQLTQAAADAANARQAWLHARRAWDPLITDTRGTISPATTETADLALWTGRLVYANPAWTPDLGPAHTPRTPDQLTPQPADRAAVLAAIHHTCDTLSQLAVADHDQIRTASLNGRLLLPTRSLPESFDIPYAFGPAPDTAAQPLLAAYRDAQEASAQAARQTAAIAHATRAPSPTLVTASQIGVDSRSAPSRQQAARHSPGTELPGPIERILHDLGVTSPDALQQATTIDRAAEQLILESARQPDPDRLHATPRDPSRSANTAEVINHLLTSGDPRAAALLYPPGYRRFPQAEIEP